MTLEGKATVDLYKRVTDTFTAIGTVVLAATLVVTALGYLEEERTGRLQRTSELLRAPDVDEELRIALFAMFPGRWTTPVIPMTHEEAQSFFDIGRQKPEKNQEVYDRWNVARKHLNRVETLAFAYLHDLADTEILAAARCAYMSRSNDYSSRKLAKFRVLSDPLDIGGQRVSEFVRVALKLSYVIERYKVQS
jgi:hypothetical protein